MKLLKDFKNFAFGGSLIDLAIGIAIGAAFTDVLDALVEKVILPLVAAIFGEPNFDRFKLTVGKGVIEYGSFLTVFLQFVLVAFTIMMLVKMIVRITGHEPAGAQGSRECDHCKEWIAVDASVCRFCTRDVTPVVDG